MKIMMWLITFTAALFSSVGVPSQGESSKASDEAFVRPQNLETNKTIPLGASLRLIPTIKKGTHQCNIRIVFPQFEGALTPAMLRFNELVKQHLEEDIEPWSRGCAENDYFHRDYLISHADNRLVSVLFKDNFLTGGPSPAQNTSVINYDLIADHELMLWDLFKPNSNYLKLISDYALHEISKNETLAGKQCEQAKGFTFPTDINYKNWLLNAKGLSVHFEHTDSFPYQVYPEDVVVEIPFAYLKDVIVPDGPAAHLLPNGPEASSSHNPIRSKVKIYDVLDDGQYYAFIKQISFCAIPEGEMTFDMVELLTGAAALKAAKEDGEIPKEQDSIDNDYYIRNRNPLLRTFPISEQPELKLLHDNSNLWQLARHVNGDSGPMGADQPYIAEDLFLLTIEKGKIVKIETQYLP